MKARMITAIIAVIVSTLAVSIMSCSFLLNYKAEAQRTFVTRVLVGGGNDTFLSVDTIHNEWRSKLEAQ